MDEYGYFVYPRVQIKPEYQYFFLTIVYSELNSPKNFSLNYDVLHFTLS